MCINNNPLAQFTDQELREELKRRAAIRKVNKAKVLHCRDCRYCGQGKHNPNVLMLTTICLAKPKLKHGCYFATTLSNRACELFKHK